MTASPLRRAAPGTRTSVPGARVDGLNKYGNPVTIMVCEACGYEFRVCPPVDPEKWGPNCLGDECPSYDIDRDPTYLFAPDDPDLREGQQ